MTTIVPTRRLQSEQALRRANHIRLTRAAIKRNINAMPYREGREAVCRLILDPGDLWNSAKLEYVLRCPDRSGPSFVARVLVCGKSPISPVKRLGSLTQRQRDEIVAFIREPLA